MSPLDRFSSRPLFEQLASQLRDAIRSGELAPGEQIPSAADLQESYECSRWVAVRAVDLLKSEGFVLTAKGRGTFVREQPLVVYNTPTRHLREQRPAGMRPFQAECAAQGLEGKQLVTEAGLRVPPARVAALLGLTGEHDEAVMRRAMLTANDVPIAIVDSYFPLSIAQGTRLQEATLIEGGNHAYLSDELGVVLHRLTESVRAREATTSEAEMLALRTGEWVLEKLRVALDVHDEVVQVGVWAMAGDRNVIVMDMPVT